MGYMRQSDVALTVLWAGYNQWEPKGIYRSYNINGDIYSQMNFGGTILGYGLEYNVNMNFKNFWSAWAGGYAGTNNLDPTYLRGGPMMKTPGNTNGRIGFSSDSRKKVVVEFYSNINTGYEKNYNSFYSGIEISYKPTNFLSVSFDPNFNKSYNKLQYVTNLTANNEDKYIFATIDRKTISTSFRINLNLSPDLTLQYWGQPFIATGKYYDYKNIVEPMADKYSDRFSIFPDEQINLVDDQYEIDENTDGTADYSFDKQDFKVQEFLSNMVLRWEYNPGSSIYLVWSQSRSNSEDSGNFDLLNDLGGIFDKDDNKPHNVFLVKFSYRFGLK
jgi:hypothetical protein